MALKPESHPLFTQHLGRRLVCKHAYPSSTPLPKKKTKTKKKTSAGAAWGKMCLADQKYGNRKGCSSSSSSLFFSYFTLLHLGPPAAPCWHNVCVGAKNTKVQTERSSQHTHLWHMFEQGFQSCCCLRVILENEQLRTQW